MKITLFVMSPHSSRKFVAQVHVHTDPRQFFLDPQEFYLKWGREIPQGAHYELELLEPSTKVLRETPIHVHASGRSKNLFVCYPHPIPTLDKAIEIFTVWCVGTVSTWDLRMDINIIHNKCKGNNRRFLSFMNKQHHMEYDIHICDIV